MLRCSSRVTLENWRPSLKQWNLSTAFGRYSRSRVQFFPIWTLQPVNNIYLSKMMTLLFAFWFRVLQDQWITKFMQWVKYLANGIPFAVDLTLLLLVIMICVCMLVLSRQIWPLWSRYFICLYYYNWKYFTVCSIILLKLLFHQPLRYD